MNRPRTDFATEPATWPEPRTEFYGLRVVEDEDGALVVQGHPALRRLLAACNLYARSEWGLVNLLDSTEWDAGDVDRLVSIRRLWWDTRHEQWVPEGAPEATAWTVVSL